VEPVFLSPAPKTEDAGVIASPTGPLVVAPAGPGTVPLLSLVIPTLNERENIEAFLAEVRSTLDGTIPGRYEIIVVDDDSPDGTCEAAAALMASFPELVVVRRRNERGLARAVIRGWQVARGEVLGTINGDFQHPPGALAPMLEKMEGSDLVVATRHADGGGLGDWGVMRRLTSWGAAVLGRLILPEVFARISDPLSGCYFIRREAVAGVELKPLGYKSLMEVMVRGRVQRIRECGYQMRKRERGKSKVHALHPAQYLRHIFRLRAAARERK
jgi:dolichol-phosphate mannosyltransferase